MIESKHAASFSGRVGLPELVGDRDLCALFGVSQQTIYFRLQRGELPRPTLVIGRRRYWPRDLIERFVRGELAPSETKADGVDRVGALEQAAPKEEGARGDVPSHRAPEVGSTVSPKAGRAKDRNPKQRGGPDRGNSN